MTRRLCCWCLLVALAGAQSATFDPTIPAGQGVNIHFTTPRPGELEMLSAAGFTWVRTDLTWRATERTPGSYDFSAYDRLWSALTQRGLHAIFTLDYGNPLYDGGLAPFSDAGRTAFAAWARAAATHFRGRPILWELYNEPNTAFWKPAPRVADYILLAKAVNSAMHLADPSAVLIGPASSGFDFTFLEACFKAGLLNDWASVSVHPYRPTPPETAAAGFGRLRGLLEQYGPPGRQIPIISGEWGYSSLNPGIDERQQGILLARQWLANLLAGVPLSIWYDWRDDGPPNSLAAQAHYGTVRQPYLAGQQPVFSPKPAYLAAQTFTSVLGGFAFSRRLETGSGDDYVLEFRRGDEARYALWTTGAAHVIDLGLQERYIEVSFDGATRVVLPPGGAQGISLEVNPAPVYLMVN